MHYGSAYVVGYRPIDSDCRRYGCRERTPNRKSPRQFSQHLFTKRDVTDTKGLCVRGRGPGYDPLRPDFIDVAGGLPDLTGGAGGGAFSILVASGIP